MAFNVAKAETVAAIKPDNGGRAVGKGELVFKVDDYGAIGDGTTDDATAINATLTAANTGGNSKVVFSKGKTYAISVSINGKSNVNIEGNGATLKWIGSGDRPLFFSSVSNITVSDLTIDAGSPPPTGSMVFGTGCDRLNFIRVKLTSTSLTGAGFRLTTSTNSSIDQCPVQGTANAYNITGLSSFCRIQNSHATGTLAGVLINPSGTSAPSDIDVIGVTVSDFPDAVLSYPIRSAGSSTALNKRIRFDHCTVIGRQNHGYIDGVTNGGTADQINAVYTDGYTVTGCTSIYGGDMGFSFSNCIRVTMTGNLAQYNTACGIVCSGGSSFVTITGNTSMNNGQNWNNHAPNDVARAGIGSTTANNVTITGNTVGDDQVTATQTYGVRLQLGGDNITIGANNYKGNTLAKFYTDGTATNVANMDIGVGDILGKRADYNFVTASATASTTGSGWQAFTGAPTVTLPNDGGIYRLDLHGTGATVSVAGVLSLALSGDGGMTWIKQASHNHNNTITQDRVHMVAGSVVGSGQTISVWAQAPAGTATLTASNSSPLEMWVTRIA